MTTDRERYLLARCLRLEAEIARLRGVSVAPFLPPIERRSLYEAPRATASAATLIRRNQRRTTDAERAQMRELHTRGLSPAQIGFRMGVSDSTVRRYTCMVLLEHEVSA